MSDGSIRVRVPCPNCGQNFKERIRELKRDEEIACPSCGHKAQGQRIPRRAAHEGPEDFARRVRRRLKRDLQ